MGTWVAFGGSPAKELYRPALAETNYDDEMATTINNLAAHTHGDPGGLPLSFGTGVVGLSTANDAGVATLPARVDHVHAHGAIAGTGLHSDYSETTHLHSGTYAPLVHEHEFETDPGGTPLWEKTIDALAGDTLWALVTDPATNGTRFAVKQHPSGAVQLVQGNIGAGSASELDPGGPAFHFIQSNAVPDGAGTEHIANGVITATSSPSRLWGDSDTTYANFTYTRGDAYIYFKRDIPNTAVPGEPRSWRVQHQQWNTDGYDSFNVAGTFTSPSLASIAFSVYPGAWTPPVADPWPVHMELNEDGDLFVRNRAEFGGHRFDFGTNNENADNQVDYGTVDGIPSTSLRIWGTPSATSVYASSIIFFPDIPGRVGKVIPDAYISDVGSVYNAFSINHVYNLYGLSAAYTYSTSATQVGFLFHGYRPSGEVGTDVGLASLTIYRDNADVISGWGLLYVAAAKHADLRVVGDNGRVATQHFAKGHDYSPGNIGNELGNLVFSNSTYGFDWASQGHLRISHWNDLSTAAAAAGGTYPSDWNVKANYGITFDVAANNGSGRQVIMTLQANSATSAAPRIGTQGRFNHVGNMLISDGQFYLKISGTWYALINGVSAYGGSSLDAILVPLGSSPPVP